MITANLVLKFHMRQTFDTMFSAMFSASKPKPKPVDSPYQRALDAQKAKNQQKKDDE